MNQSSLIEPSNFTNELALLAAKNNSIPIVQFYVRTGAPFACFQVLQGGCPSEHEAEQGFYSGKCGNRRRSVLGIEMATDGLDESCLRRLPLDGHEAVASWGIYSWIDEALDHLKTRDEIALAYIKKWCRLIVWIRKKNDSKSTEVTSVAIPEMPFCVFLSRKAIRHIPPKTIVHHVGLYALQENIYHECAHQELSAFLLCNDILLFGNVADQEIPIPWRKTYWPIDRALHAAFVYKKLSIFRQRALNCSTLHLKELHAIHDAQESGNAALIHLTAELEKSKHLLTSAGMKILSLVSHRDDHDSTPKNR